MALWAGARSLRRFDEADDGNVGDGGGEGMEKGPVTWDGSDLELDRDLVGDDRWYGTVLAVLDDMVDLQPDPPDDDIILRVLLFRADDTDEADEEDTILLRTGRMGGIDGTAPLIG